MTEIGLSEAMKTLLPVNLTLANGDRVELRVEDVNIEPPTIPIGTIGVRNHKVYPTECRQRAATYKGKMNVKVSWSINGRPRETIEKNLGEIPVMVKVIFNILISFFYNLL